MTRSLPLFKRSAVHNLRVTRIVASGGTLDEGLVLPSGLMAAAGIAPFEQIVVTNMRGGSWDNRIHSFAVPGEGDDVEGLGSLARFLEPGDLTCVIARGFVTAAGLEEIEAGRLPCIDVGFDPATNLANDLGAAALALEYAQGRKERVARVPDVVHDLHARHFTGPHLSSLLTGLVVTDTHPDCLQGSAELPGELMEAAGLARYQGVLVYNADAGGMAETYAVPMPPGVVMTTGAMAGFAPKGTRTHVASYALGRGAPPVLVRARGNSAALAERVTLPEGS